MVRLISDDFLKTVPIIDNKEAFVNVSEAVPGVIIRLGMYVKKEGKKACKDACLVREGTAKRLNKAQELLPAGHRIMLRIGYRPIYIQKKRYDYTLNIFKKKHPEWNDKRLKEETSKYTAPIDIIPSHSTGGAVDLSIIGPNMKQLDMGTRLSSLSEKTYTNSNKISTRAKKNRALLVKVMKKAGFINYPTEWWHWSYGDRYWAAVLKKKYSIYAGK